MQPIFETYVGWVILELGHRHPDGRNLNFVLYPQDRANPHIAVNCKARLMDVLQSDLREFLIHGGMCKAIVRGVRFHARQTEPGWSTSVAYEFVDVSWLTMDRGPGFFGEEDLALLSEQADLDEAHDESMDGDDEGGTDGASNDDPKEHRLEETADGSENDSVSFVFE